MASIRITKEPRGFAPAKIRKCWVGLTIPLATEEDLKRLPLTGDGIGNDNIGGYLVLAHKAIDALTEAKQPDAATYWRRVGLGHYLRFAQNVCELVR